MEGYMEMWRQTKQAWIMEGRMGRRERDQGRQTGRKWVHTLVIYSIDFQKM